jgi:hypothetical protein
LKAVVDVEQSPSARVPKMLHPGQKIQKPRFTPQLQVARRYPLSNASSNRFADTKQTRVVKKTVPTESFFNFFDPPKPPQDEDDGSSDIEERLELDYQLGEDIKEKLIPRAIDWFTGEALQYENIEDFDEGEFEDEDDDDEDELSDDRDEDEESDEEVRQAGRYASEIRGGQW